MASIPTPPPAGSAAAPGSTPIPKSYAKDIAATPDPWKECARLEYGGDRSFAASVRQQVVRTPPTGRAKLEHQLLATLAGPTCTPAGRAFVCQMLALVGSAPSVPALTLLLRDPTTTEPARFALEAIPGKEADAALREALGSVSGNAKAGLVGSIAARRDPAARPALLALSENHAEPPVVREAAARGLKHLPAS
jgi:hypothetical protein